MDDASPFLKPGNRQQISTTSTKRFNITYDYTFILLLIENLNHFEERLFAKVLQLSLYLYQEDAI